MVTGSRLPRSRRRECERKPERRRNRQQGRGSRLLQPLDPQSTTNLFIWTASGCLSYELVPAPSVQEMHLTIDCELSESSRCNVEHRYRCHDVHAEVNAITTMISSGRKQIRAVVIAAERERFTPCGGCMDWIMQFAVEPCYVLAQSTPGAPIQSFTTTELMPFYP